MKEGFYWIIVSKEICSWEIAEFRNNTWYFVGDGFSHSHEYILETVDEIGDYVDTPEKYKHSADNH